VKAFGLMPICESIARRRLVSKVEVQMYPFLLWLTSVLLRVFFRVTVEGRDNIPAQAPLVVVANHESFLDGLVVGTVLKKRRATFLAAPWLYSRPGVGGILRLIGAIPAYGGNEVAALRESIRVLRKGGAVALFPQGGIARSEISGGAVYIAIKAPAPLVPIRITGTDKALPLGRWWPSLFTRITVSVGAPIAASELCPPGVSTSAAVEQGVELLARVLLPV
jgi:1-acyl-sn-glycerol-3-phosphate acyltransferase